MSLIAHRPHHNKSHLFLMVGLCISLYFSFHLLFGERGYLKFVSLSHHYEMVSIEHASLQEKRTHLEKQVVGMRAGSIDLDLLEERVHVMLGALPADALVLKE